MQALYIAIFGINAVLLDVGIVNVFHFHAFASRVHHSRIRALRNSLGKKVAALPRSPKVPARVSAWSSLSNAF